MKQIQPKPTRFNNVLYRSRLEARYAVYLTALGLDFQYEPYTFKHTGSNHEYTPDFWLPRKRMYLEIKPAMPNQEYVQWLGQFQFDHQFWIAVGDLYNGRPYYHCLEPVIPTVETYHLVPCRNDIVLGIDSRHEGRAVAAAKNWRFDL